MRFRREWIPAVLAGVAFLVGSRLSPYFLDARYLLDATSLYIEIGLLALGLTFVIASGHIDLSVGSTLALVACLSAKLLQSGWPVGVVVPVALLVGALLGAANGWLVARFRLPSFAVTLATMALYRGAAQVLVGSDSVRVPAALVGLDYKYLPGTPVPLPLVLLLAVAGVVALVLHRAVFGRWIYALGTNAHATYRSGVPTFRVTVTAFALSGGLAALGALTMGSRLGVARFDHGRGIELEAITAVVLGGASIAGGSGSIMGTMLALLLIALVRTGMGVANVTAEYQMGVIGLLLFLAVGLGNFLQLRESKSRAPSNL